MTVTALIDQYAVSLIYRAKCLIKKTSLHMCVNIKNTFNIAFTGHSQDSLRQKPVFVIITVLSLSKTDLFDLQ